MLIVQAVATVYYTCTLTEEDEKQVREYAEKEGMGLGEAAEDLYSNGFINVYDGNVVESDCDTQKITESEFNREDE